MRKLLVCAASCLCVVCALGQSGEVPEPPLRTDPVDVVVADLEDFIPLAIRRDGVTGVAVALVRENRLVWQKGFGLAHSVTRQPVTGKTVFSAASLAKPVTAHLALQLVGEGIMELDASLAPHVTEGWLPDTDRHKAVSLRHVLTHTSGLSNFLRDERRALRFEPGTEFYYSGVGFMYLQAALEGVTSKSLDELARERLFEPLGMTASFFGQRLPGVSTTHGHVNLARAIAPFLIIFTPALIVLLLVAAVLSRLIAKSWKVGRVPVAAVSGLAVVGTFLFLEQRAGGVILAGYFTTCALLFLAVSFILARLGVSVTRRFVFRQPAVRRVLRASLVVASVLLLFFLLRGQPVPLPDWFPAEGNAASSLRTTAGDMAKFVIELGEGRQLDSTLVTQMRTPQVEVSEHVSWGLGTAIQHSRHGDSVWHWGSNPGSKAVMVYYPASGDGVVVLSNSSRSSNLVAEIAARALGGKAYWDW